MIFRRLPNAWRRVRGQLPAGIDYGTNIYFFQERGGMLLGTYEPQSTPWKINGMPLDFGHELFNPELDCFADRLEKGSGV